MYLEEGQNEKDQRVDDKVWADISRLLSRKHDRIHPLAALDLLPSQVRPHNLGLVTGFTFQNEISPNVQLP